jgi:hypothetical protein
MIRNKDKDTYKYETSTSTADATPKLKASSILKTISVQDAER